VYNQQCEGAKDLIRFINNFAPRKKVAKNVKILYN